MLRLENVSIVVNCLGKYVHSCVIQGFPLEMLSVLGRRNSSAYGCICCPTVSRAGHDLSVAARRHAAGLRELVDLCGREQVSSCVSSYGFDSILRGSSLLNDWCSGGSSKLHLINNCSSYI